MNQHIFVVTAMLKSVAYNSEERDARVVPEADFIPFKLSYLRDFCGQGEQQAKNRFGARNQDASDALPA